MIKHSVTVSLEKSEFQRQAGILCLSEINHVGSGCSAVEMVAYLPASNSITAGGFAWEGEYPETFDSYRKMVIDAAKGVIEDMERVIDKMKSAENPYRNSEDGLPLFRDDPNT